MKPMEKKTRHGKGEPPNDRGSSHFRWSGAVGHSGAQAAMKSAFLRKRLPQVMLIEGREGLGKSMLAAYAASLWLCEQDLSCGDCTACIQVQSMEHPEVFCLGSDDEPSIGLSAVDQLREHLSFKPHVHSASKAARVGVILDVDRLTTQAANRLLKTLEEPSEHAFVVMTTSRPRRVIDTIMSRTVRWKLAPPLLEHSVAWLHQRTGQDESLLKVLLGRFGFSPGKVAEYLAENPSGELEDSLAEGLVSGQMLQVLGSAQKIGKQKHISAAKIAEQTEILLNAMYRKNIGNVSSKSIAEKVSSVRMRRDTLSHVHQVAGKQKVSLNSQLTAEAIGLL